MIQSNSEFISNMLEVMGQEACSHKLKEQPFITGSAFVQRAHCQSQQERATERGKGFTQTVPAKEEVLSYTVLSYTSTHAAAGMLSKKRSS